VDFAKAEEFKIGSGRIAINSAYLQEWDEQTGALAQSVTNAMSRLPSEVTRTINYWRSQEGGSPPTKILLAGGGSNMPYFKEYVEERLSIPTEYFNPLQNVFLSSEIDQEKIVFEAHTLGELVGLAAKAAKNSELSIDLVPDSISERRAEDRKKPFFVSASLIACAGALIWAGTQFLGNVRADAALTEIKKEVASYSDIDKGISKVTKETKTLESENKHLSELVEERYRAVEQLDELKSYLSSEVVWLKSVEEVVNYKFDDPEGVEDQALVKDSSVNYGTSALSSKHKGTKSTKRKKSTKGDDEKAINALLIKGYWRANPQNQQVVFEMLEKIKSAENSRFTLTYKNNELDDSEVLFIDTVIPDGKIKAEFKLILPLKNPIEIVTK